MWVYWRKFMTYINNYESLLLNSFDLSVLLLKMKYIGWSLIYQKVQEDIKALKLIYSSEDNLINLHSYI